MAETLSFWLDNKMSSGIKVAEAGGQALVLYRERYYVVADGAAQTRAGKTVRYAKSSLPAFWRKVLRGGIIPAAPEPPPEEAMPLPQATRTGRERTTMNRPPRTEQPAPVAPLPAPAAVKPRKKADAKPAAQSTVTACCPYCNQKHELPVEKGKNGKAFLLACSRCTSEFAVRFVQVIQYQAQTAGFR